MSGLTCPVCPVCQSPLVTVPVKHVSAIAQGFVAMMLVGSCGSLILAPPVGVIVFLITLGVWFGSKRTKRVLKCTGHACKYSRTIIWVEL